MTNTTQMSLQRAFSLFKKDFKGQTVVEDRGYKVRENAAKLWTFLCLRESAFRDLQGLKKRLGSQV